MNTQTYSLEELLRLPPQKLFEVEMRQLPLPERYHKYFINQAWKYEKHHSHHPEDRSSYIPTLRAYSVLKNKNFNGNKKLAILELMKKLGIEPYNIFKSKMLEGLTKSEILTMSLRELCFPYPEGVQKILWQKKWEDRRERGLTNSSLEDVLQIGFEDIPIHYGSRLEVHLRNVSPKMLYEIQSHIIQMGFEIDEFPLLNSQFRIAYEKEIAKKTDALETQLTSIHQCTREEAKKIITIAQKKGWI